MSARLRPKPTIVRKTNVRLAGERAEMTPQYLSDLKIRIGAYDFVHPLLHPMLTGNLF